MTQWLIIWEVICYTHVICNMIAQSLYYLPSCQYHPRRPQDGSRGCQDVVHPYLSNNLLLDIAKLHKKNKATLAAATESYAWACEYFLLWRQTALCLERSSGHFVFMTVRTWTILHDHWVLVLKTHYALPNVLASYPEWPRQTLGNKQRRKQTNSHTHKQPKKQTENHKLSMKQTNKEATR